MNNFEPFIFFGPFGKRRLGLYAEIPVPVLQIPVGKEGGPGGLPNLLRRKRRVMQYKKEDYDDKEEMEGKRRDEDEHQESLEGHLPGTMGKWFEMIGHNWKGL